MSRSPVGGPAPAFDPAKCDHGSEHAGRIEFDWCDNCDPERAARVDAQIAAAHGELLRIRAEAFAVGVAATKEAIARRLDEDGIPCTADEVRALSVEPPTDGRTSSEANYDPMTAPVPEGDMNGPHGEPWTSSEGGQR